MALLSGARKRAKEEGLLSRKVQHFYNSRRLEHFIGFAFHSFSPTSQLKFSVNFLKGFWKTFRKGKSFTLGG